MKKSTAFTTLLIVVAGFAIYYFLFQNFGSIKVALDKFTHRGLISYLITYLIIGIPVFIATYIINRRSIFESLGLSKNIWTGIWTSAIFTIPMFVGGLIFFKLRQEIELENLLAGTVVAGFMEELYFRGFLFGQIFRNTKIGFIPAIFLGALIFASGHLYQSQVASELVGIFLVTFSGAIFFAWLFVEWKYNLWVPIFTHTLMNLSWDLFDLSNNALGGMQANVFRALTIITAIALTIFLKKRKGEKLAVNRETLFSKRVLAV